MWRGCLWRKPVFILLRSLAHWRWSANRRTGQYHSAFVSPQLFPGHWGDSHLQQCAYYTLTRQAEWSGWGKALHLPIKGPCKQPEPKEHSNPLPVHGNQQWNSWFKLSQTQVVVSHQAKAGTALALDWFSWPYAIWEAMEMGQPHRE